MARVATDPSGCRENPNRDVGAMNDEDLDKYLPRATPQQRATVKAYHAAGWTVELMVPNSHDIEISIPCACDCMDHAWILPCGNVVPL